MPEPICRMVRRSLRTLSRPGVFHSCLAGTKPRGSTPKLVWENISALRLTAVHILASGANRSGGAEVYTSELIKRLPTRGFDVTLFCPDHKVDEEFLRVCRVVNVSRGRSNDLPLAWRLSPALQLVSVSR